MCTIICKVHLYCMSCSSSQRMNRLTVYRTHSNIKTNLVHLSADPSCCHHAAELSPCKEACDQVWTHTNTLTETHTNKPTLHPVIVSPWMEVFEREWSKVFFCVCLFRLFEVQNESPVSLFVNWEQVTLTLFLSLCLCLWSPHVLLYGKRHREETWKKLFSASI